MLALFRLKGTNAKTCTFFFLLPLGDQRLLSEENSSADSKCVIFLPLVLMQLPDSGD